MVYGMVWEKERFIELQGVSECTPKPSPIRLGPLVSEVDRATPKFDGRNPQQSASRCHHIGDMI